MKNVPEHFSSLFRFFPKTRARSKKVEKKVEKRRNQKREKIKKKEVTNDKSKFGRRRKKWKEKKNLELPR